MSNLNSTITLKKSIKEEARESGKEHPRDTWDDIIIRLVDSHEKLKNLKLKIKNKKNLTKKGELNEK